MKALDQAKIEVSAHHALRQRIPRFLRDSVVISVVAFVFLAGLIMLGYEGMTKTKVQDALNHLRPQAEYMASLIDLRAHTWLAKSDQTDSQPYTALMERLQKVRQFYPDITQLYTGRYQDGNVSVVLETQTARHPAKEKPYLMRPLGFSLPEGSKEREAIEKRMTLAMEKSGLNPAGDFLGVIVPLNNPSSSVRDFLYVDTSRETLDEALATARQYRNIGLVTAGLLALIIGVVSFNAKTRSFYRQALAMTGMKENAELFRSTYELSPVPMCLTKKDGRILRANAAFLHFTGYREEELHSMEPSTLISVEDLHGEGKQIQDLETNNASKYQSERRYIRKDGTSIWGLVSVAIVRDSEANISHYLVQVVDISERKIAEEILRDSEERLALAAQAGQVGTWDFDLVKKTVVWNNVMHTIHGSTVTPQSQEGYAAHIHDEDRPRISMEFHKAMVDGSPLRLEYRVKLPAGGYHYVHTNAVVYTNDKSRPIRIVGTCIDVTREKEESEELVRAKESALAADKAKSEFLAVMSHEIRTPLNGVLGFVSMLKNTPLDSEQLSYIDTMESSGQGLLTLVNDILDLSKIESKEIHVEPTTFDIRPFLRRIHAQLQSQAHQKGLHYECAVEYSVPKSIHTDQMRLGQILTNILGNALKFTEHGEVALVVTAKPVGFFQRDWEWRFTIRDTGPGIPNDAIPSLFTLFYQVDSSATRRHGGTGLGLAISQRLAKLLNGDITVTSRVGEGSEFTIVVQAPKGYSGSLANMVPTAKPIDSTSVGFKGKRILVVEDNPINRKLCALQLKRLGCEAEFAETGLEAVDKVRRFSYDAVLMDMQLPDLDGCGATRRIRGEILGAANLSIIALTANAMPEDRKKCLDAGMNDFLSKPLQYETLAATLSKWV